MPWNETDRERYAVIRERYASDLSDAEFALVQPLLSPAKPPGLVHVGHGFLIVRRIARDFERSA